MIPGRQMRGEQGNRCQGERAVLEQFQDKRKRPRCAGCGYAPIRSVFGEVQSLGAEYEERRVGVNEVETPDIYFADRGDQRSGGDSLTCRERVDLSDQLVIGEPREVLRVHDE
jgi:hypothetical protein